MKTRNNLTTFTSLSGKKYEDKWVAIASGKVIAASESLSELFKKADKLSEKYAIAKVPGKHAMVV